MPNITDPHEDVTPQAIAVPHHLVRGSLGLVLTPAERVKAFQDNLESQAGMLDALDAYITKRLQPQRDFGVIPGTQRPSLLQPGAQRVCQALQLVPTFSYKETEDPERKTPYDFETGKRGKRKRHQGTAVGFYQCTVTCTLHGQGPLDGAQGIGSCSSLESKYIDRRYHDTRHTVMMIAAKRAYVSAARTVACLSDRFTQDLEDLPEGMIEEEAEATGAPQTTGRASTPVPPRPNAPQPAPGPKAPPSKPTGPLASKGQISRLIAIGHQSAAAQGLSSPYEKLRQIVKEFGFDDTDEVTVALYDRVVARVEEWGSTGR